MPGVSVERSLTHPGKNPVPFNVELSGFDSQFLKVNCHRRHLVLIRKPCTMLGRTGKHMDDAVGKALDRVSARIMAAKKLIFQTWPHLFLSSVNVRSLSITAISLSTCSLTCSPACSPVNGCAAWSAPPGNHRITPVSGLTFCHLMPRKAESLS